MENKNLNNPENKNSKNEQKKDDKDNQQNQSKQSSKKDKRRLKKEQRKKKKEAKIAERQKKNTRWFWFFILFLSAIVLLFLWDNYRKANFIKKQQYKIDTLNNSLHVYKSKYEEKDSALKKLLKNYNSLLEQNVSSLEELTDNKKELLRLRKIVYMQDSILREVKTNIDAALSGYANDEISVEMKGGKLYVTMRNKLLFPSGSANIQSGGRNALRTLSDVLKDNPNLEIVIEGHTDNVPFESQSNKFTDNWDLSTARAVAVTKILINQYNIRPERITAAGRSMFFPVAPNTTVKGRAKNRRIEVILSPDLEQLYKISKEEEEINL